MTLESLERAKAGRAQERTRCSEASEVARHRIDGKPAVLPGQHVECGVGRRCGDA